MCPLNDNIKLAAKQGDGNNGQGMMKTSEVSEESTDTQCDQVSSTCKFPKQPMLSTNKTHASRKARVFICERCNEGFEGMAALRQHCRALHGDQKYYKCNVCTKLFSHPSSRNIHLRLHSGEKPYKCETCGKRFRVSSHLKDHIRVHTGERPYICDICHKGFKQSSDLKKHRRTHTLDKPYKCPLCPSAFTRSHHCRGHINSVHKFFKCVTCSALFTSEDDFSKHKELHPSLASGQNTSKDGLVSGAADGMHNPVHSNQEMKAVDQPQYWKTTSNVMVEGGKDHLTDSSSRSRENIALAEFMASMAIQRSAVGLLNSSDEKEERSNKKVVHSQREIPREKMNNHLLSQDHQQGILSQIDGNYWFPGNYVQRKLICSDKMKEASGHHIWVAAADNSALVRYSLPSTGLEDMSLHHQPLSFNTRHLKNTSTVQPAVTADQAVDAGFLSDTQKTTRIPCHRVPVIHFHSSSASKEMTDIQEIGVNTQQKADEKLHSHDKEECFKDLIHTESCDFIDKELEGIHCKNGYTMSSGFNEPFVPTDDHDRAIGGHLVSSPDTGQISHTANKAARDSLLRKRDYPSTSCDISEDVKYILLEKGTVQNIVTQEHDHSDVDHEYVTLPKSANKLSVMTNEHSSSDVDDGGDREDADEWDAKARFVNIAPKPEQSNAKDIEEDKPYKCIVCQKCFSRSSLLKQHSVIHQGNKRFKFKCETCDKMFRTRSHLRDHVRIHTGERPFKCPICSRAFKQSSDLKKHINLHTGANQFKCEECNMEFRRGDALRKHRLGHQTDEKFVCNYCGSQFDHYIALQQHQAIHTGFATTRQTRSLLRCNFCFKTFPQSKQEAYQQHCTMHTQEMEASSKLSTMIDCTICSKQFTYDSELRDHMNILHTGNKPYKCMVCNKDFCRHLKDHSEIHSELLTRGKN